MFTTDHGALSPLPNGGKMKTYSFTLNEQQIQVIAAGLENLPFKVSASVIREMNEQFQAQQIPPPPVEVTDEKDAA